MKNHRNRADRQSQPVQGMRLASNHDKEHDHDHEQAERNLAQHDGDSHNHDHQLVGRPGGRRTTGPSVTTLLTLVTQCAPLMA